MLGLKGVVAGLGLGLVLGITGVSAASDHAGTGAPSVSQAAVKLQHVTLIGDSVADGISGDPAAVEVVSRGINLDLELAPCRRVDEDSCPYNGVRPPNVVDLVNSMGSTLGPNVIVAVGYNDFADQYAQNIETALAALKAAGVAHVWWLTLRAAHQPYVPMNAEIFAAADQHPEMTVIDWNKYSRSHPDWFQPDGLHLLGPGVEQMAALIHSTLVADGIAPGPVAITTATLPVAHRLQPYQAALAAKGGVGPLEWTLLERAPAGIHLLSSGAIEGVARARPGAYVFDVRVVDAGGDSQVRDLTLRVT